LPSQLILPLHTAPALGRADFIVGSGNAEAVAFIDSYPGWAAPAAALVGPPGSGKSHLVAAWAAASDAIVIEASRLDERVAAGLIPGAPVAIENVDAAPGTSHEGALFALFNAGGPVLLTGREAPRDWPVLLPDLGSRYAALLAFTLWQPDDALLASIARKLFTDRQLDVPQTVIQRMLRSVERSPAAIRDFVARADARALAEKRPITAALVSDMLAEGGGDLS
jgi:chromosomal replication initiation ATPase DnaA